MTIVELNTLMQDMESDRIERTISFREDKLGPAVCAFANDLPNHRQAGYLLMGVDDKTGQPAGITIGDEELQKIGNIRSNGNVLPQPYMTVSPVFHLVGGDVVVITVHPAEKRIATARTFDEQSALGSKLQDLSMDTFTLSYLPSAVDAETLAENGRTPKEQLASLGFYDLIRDQCTYAGLLMFGNNPRSFLKGAYLQYVKFDSPEMDVESKRAEKEFSGPLVAVLKNLDDFVQVIIVKQKSVRRNGAGFQETTLYNYPSWALRELLMNAVMHRDYESNAPIYLYEFSDRIEIINPGGLYGDARPENFPEASDYRNPIIAAAMKNLGYVNRFNFGVKNAQKKLRENGNPEAKFELGLQTKFSVNIPVNPNWLE